jgi:hypothetical protein
MGGYTHTPVAINVKIAGFPDIVAHRVQIQHTVNDFSRCEVSVIARNSNEVVAFKEIFPTLSKAAPFTKMTVSVAIKSGDLNTIKQFSNLWSGTLTGISPSFSPGSVQFTLHGLGGLFYSSTVAMFAPGFHPGTIMGGGALTGEFIRGTIGTTAKTFVDIVDLFKLFVSIVEKYGIEMKLFPALNQANGQAKGIKYDLLKSDLKKIKKVEGMSWPKPLAIIPDDKSKSYLGHSWLQFFQNQVLSNPQETFWTIYASSCITQHAQLITIGDNVILSPAFWLDEPPNGNKGYDPINPATNIIYAEDLLSVSPGINPFDAPTRVGTFVGMEPGADGNMTGQDLYRSCMTNAGGFKCFPSGDNDSGILTTITQQEGLTGARIQIVQPEHWLLGAISWSKFGRAPSYENGGALTQDPDDRQDESINASQIINDDQEPFDESVRLYLKSRYYKEVLAQRAGAVQCRLRLDCVPGLPCRVIAPWDAFTIDAYVLAVTHVISTTPEAASTMLQFSHARFLNEKVNFPNPLYAEASVKSALPVFEAAARGSATGQETGTADTDIGGADTTLSDKPEEDDVPQVAQAPK